ncbi:hypothetical protein C8K30_108222 [Promicromonospora sp. AC04]|uniref:hypothetical protein n=1 Tax=Promicromonospora sp. AC04 TaxID=2135723 RepID=UPI000D3FC300|nr:hypothetical protein [Promicromonospora sp. AC04]PUB24965.1 hypothetical protein C8K30_108222 [Promicromonospora sp. AC04]
MSSRRPRLPPLRALTRESFALLAASVTKPLVPMARLLDEPPGEGFAAYRTTHRLPLNGPAFDPDAALRLHDLTQDLVHNVRG